MDYMGKFQVKLECTTSEHQNIVAPVTYLVGEKTELCLNNILCYSK